jgi:hypothetical protein
VPLAACSSRRSTTTTAAPPTTVPAATGASIFHQTGSGAATTPTFVVPAEWQLAWSYDCSKFSGGLGVFEIDVVALPGNAGIAVAENDQPISALGTKGSGVQSFHDGGTVALKVSECAWSLKVSAG